MRVEAAPFIQRRIPNYEILDEEGLALIEANAETVLEEIGVRFAGDPEALKLWRDAGADVRGDRVHLPRGLARSLCATAPREYVQHARNPERNVTIGGKGLVLAPVYGPPFVRDMENGRRYATIEDFRNFVKLAYSSKWVHHAGGTVCEPTDIAVNKRHLDMLLAHMTLSDKPFMGSVTAPERAADSVEMCRILFGVESVGPNCYMTSLININSPLVFDATMMGALEVYARAGQATIVSPFIVGGAMAPVSVAGTLTQVLAEATCGIAYAQLVNPGCPVIFGGLRDLDRHELGSADLRHARGVENIVGAGQLARRPRRESRRGLRALVVLAAPRDRDLDEFPARDGHRRRARRVQRARARHRDFEAQRRLVADGLELVRRSVRDLHEKPFDATNGASPSIEKRICPRWTTQNVRVSGCRRRGVRSPGAIEMYFASTCRSSTSVSLQLALPACCARSSASFQCGRCTPT